MITPEIQQYVQSQIAAAQKNTLYSVKNASYHTHNGIDSPKLVIPSSGSTSIAGLSTTPATTSRTDDGGGGTLVDLDTNVFATGITWDGTGHGFVALTAGYYVVIGSVFITSATVNDIIKAIIYQNSTIVAQGYQDAFQSAQVFTVSCIVSLAVGDEVYLYSSDGAHSYSLNTSATQTFLSIASV